MKYFTTDKPEIPIVHHEKPDGSKWTIKEKLLLGLTVQDYKTMVLRSKVNWVLIVLLAVGIPLILQPAVDFRAPGLGGSGTDIDQAAADTADNAMVALDTQTH